MADREFFEEQAERLGFTEVTCHLLDFREHGSSARPDWWELEFVGRKAGAPVKAKLHLQGGYAYLADQIEANTSFERPITEAELSNLSGNFATKPPNA